MKNQFLQVVLGFCSTHELQTKQTSAGDYIWITTDDFVRISAFLQALLVLRFPSISFDRCLYNDKVIVCAKFNNFDVCVTSESEVF